MLHADDRSAHECQFAAKGIPNTTRAVANANAIIAAGSGIETETYLDDPDGNEGRGDRPRLARSAIDSQSHERVAPSDSTCRHPARQGSVHVRSRQLGTRLGHVAALAAPIAAQASSCANFSRPAPACNLACTSPVVDGNWIWLPSVGVPLAAWGFAPPGTPDSQLFGFPGANGNYTNGQTASLLGMSAICTNGGGGVLFKRQDGVFVIVVNGGDPSLLKGVWSGCE